ncbi:MULTISPECIES: glycosyltransferase family A protein [Arthrobacter]|uniref:Glycosyltransferase family A protein n=2 Tax=Arthrobacter TaxID=1663 RepID=A0ABU9KNP7_9MICC|nr:glycosyltransferase family A protein [Arthrobacter sp. YJM1]MDP5227715.1 glycosyltransferase family A protein [Arthrobacter sp. YJM1]
MNDVAATVVVPSRGGRDRLPRLLESLARQDRADFEVIVVLDGDIDDSQTFVETWRSTLNVRSVVFPENRGRAAALNAGADAARAEVLIRADDDLEVGPDFVAGHVLLHESRSCGVIGLSTNVYPDNAYARAYGVRADKRFIAGALDVDASHAWRYWAGNVSVTREDHRRIGGYDLRFRKYGWEDVDFGYRLAQSGVPILIAPELMARHHGASLSTAARAVRALHSGAARESFTQIHGEEALGSVQRPSGVWGGLTWLTSRAVNERLLRAYGAAADAVSPYLPRRVGEKLVALAVESAGLAGIRFPERARSTF